MSARKPRKPKLVETGAVAPPAVIVPPVPAPLPDPAFESLMAEARQGLIEATRLNKQRNLDRAVLLAQQAARGHGPLVEHFQELGRRFCHLLEEPPKPNLRLVKGGDA